MMNRLTCHRCVLWLWLLSLGASCIVAGDLQVPVRQPTDGPLPLSLQNEVDAAIDRGRKGLIALFEAAELSAIDHSTRLLGQLALLTATDPTVLEARDALLRGMLDSPPPETDPERSAHIALQVLALQARPTPRVSDDALDTLNDALAEQVQSVLQSPGQPLPEPDVLTAMQTLLDAGQLAGLTVSALVPETQTQALKTLLRQKAPEPPPASDAGEATIQWMDRFLPACLLLLALSEPDRLPEPFRAGMETLTKSAMATAFSLDDAESSFRAWMLVRCFNTTPQAAATVQRNWRHHVARRMVGTQRIDPADGAGYWSASGTADPMPPGMDAIRLSALSLLILLSL